MSLDWILPVWAWLLIALACLFVAGHGYHHLQGPRPLRAVCAGLRGVLLLVICLLIAGPQRVQRQDTVNPYTVHVFVDDSASMRQQDVLADDTAIARVAAVEQTLKTRADWARKPTVQQRVLRWSGLAEQVSGGAGGAEESDAGPWAGLFEADQQQTLIPQAINRVLSSDGFTQAFSGAAGVGVGFGDASGGGSGSGGASGGGGSSGGGGGSLGAVVLISDGRSQQAVTETWLASLGRRGVPVVVVPVGPAEALLDLMVAQVIAPDQAYVGDPVPVVARVEQLSGQAVAPESVTVQLLDVDTQAVVDERTLAEANDGQIELVARSQAPGRARYRVSVQVPGEKITANNAQELALEWVEDPIQVLYVEAYPRWEYRYLASALTRETSIESSMLLVASARADDGRFVQEGDTPIQRFPNTARELSPYDVLIIGDVPVSAFSQAQLDLIRAHVSGEGAGLILLGGPQQMPTGWGDSPLAALLPMREPALVQGLSIPSGGYLMRPADAAQQAGVMRLTGPDAAGSDDVAGWPNVLSPLLYGQRLGDLKPAVEVWARLHAFSGPPERAVLGEGHPVVTRMPFGSGSVVYAGTDETWRYRRGRGGLYFEQHWIQLVRALGKQRVQQTGAGRAALTVSDKRVLVGSPVAVSLRLTDPDLIDRRLGSAEMAVQRLDDQGVALPRVDPPVLLPGAVLPTDTQAVASHRFEAVWTPTKPGRYRLTIAGGLSGLGLEQVVTVVSDSAEMRDTRTGFAALAQIAEASGGRVLPLEELHRLPEVLQALSVPQSLVQTQEHRQPLWNGYLAWLVVLTLLTGEWVLRKAAQLA